MNFITLSSCPGTSPSSKRWWTYIQFGLQKKPRGRLNVFKCFSVGQALWWVLRIRKECCKFSKRCAFSNQKSPFFGGILLLLRRVFPSLVIKASCYKASCYWGKLKQGKLLLRRVVTRRVVIKASCNKASLNKASLNKASCYKAS